MTKKESDDKPEITKAIAEILWDVLPRDPEHEDRRKTSIGTKTKIGLRRTLESVLKRKE